ncbi:hypothetical protein D3C81_2013990 [compost metagenome]
MAVGAIALGTGAVGGQHRGDLGAGAMSAKDRIQKLNQRFVRQVRRGCIDSMIVWHRHLKLQNFYWRGQQRSRDLTRGLNTVLRGHCQLPLRHCTANRARSPTR